MKVQAVTKQDRAAVSKLINEIDLFTLSEKEVVFELLEIYLTNSLQKDYQFFVTLEDNGDFSSFICFGPTPMTENTYDLYWIATHPAHRRKGLALALIRFMSNFMTENNAKIIRVETSGKELYGETVKFYDHLNFSEEARIRDFYADGDDLVIFTHRLKQSLNV